jgi:hypothetical protein
MKTLRRTISIMLFTTATFPLPSHFVHSLLKINFHLNFHIDILGHVFPFMFLSVVLIQSFGVQFYVLVVTHFLFFSFCYFLMDFMNLLKHFHVTKRYFVVFAYFLSLLAVLKVAWGAFEHGGRCHEAAFK